MPMRRVLIAVAAATAMLIGSGGQAWADPPRPSPSSPLPSGWTIEDGKLTWTSARPVPMGDAQVEFYSGDAPLGRARASKDQRTFQLKLPATVTDLQVRAGGKRLDAAAPAPSSLRGQATPTLPAELKPAAIDPGAKGPYSTITGEYSLPGVKLPDFPVPVEMQAVVVAPKGAPGRRPLALFLHGRHYTCFKGADESQLTGDWPCPAGTKPVPSYRGYLQAQQLLASQGYITVSISANGINGQDFAAADGGAQARSSLVRLHLADWADWAGGKRRSAPAIAKAAPPADMSKVFLMGHSRGGEGVSRAAMDSLNPPPAAQDGYHGPVRWTIRGLLLIGPTIFGQDPTPDVPSATILPGCDGDVSDLQGQMYADATRGVSRGRALHSALYVIGADHNFFNTEWTPGQATAPAFDDFSADGDPLCSPGKATRLTAAQQQNVGATYIATAARLFVAGDDRARPLLDGSGVRAPSAGPARVLSHAIGAARTAAIIPDTSVRVTNGRICTEVTNVEAQACLSGDNLGGGSPHFVGFWSAVPEPGRYAVLLNGTGTATVRPAKPVSLGAAQSLALRLIVPPNSTGNRFGVSVVDTRGHRTSLGDVRVDGLPGTDFTTSYWAQELRVPVPRKVGAVARLELTRKGGSGPAWLIDAWGWRAGTPSPQPAALPRIDIGLLTVNEGDSGTRTYQVPVNVKGHGAGKVRIFLTDPATYATKSWVADVKPTTKRVNVPVSVVGNTRYGADRQYDVFAKAVSNTTIGQYDGGLLVRNDDPMPAITITPTSATATEGSSLTWTVHLSAPADDSIYLLFPLQAPSTGPELSSTDVDPQWFTDNSGEDPQPSRPLSQTGLSPYVGVEPGKTSADLSIPIVADGVTEPAEHVQMQAEVYPAGFGDPVPVAVIDGTVTDS